MKRPADYKPEYSLSIAIMRGFMAQKEVEEIIERYVKEKKRVWRDKVKGK